MTTLDLEFIRQQHEAFLNDLEGLAVQALATGEWDKVFAHINQVRTQTNLSDCFDSPEEYDQALAFIQRLLGEASTKDLSRPGADLLPPTEQTER